MFKDKFGHALLNKQISNKSKVLKDQIKTLIHEQNRFLKFLLNFLSS